MEQAELQRPVAKLASDRDRDRAVDLLNRGLVEGRLTESMHAQRVATVLRAATRAELDAQIADITPFRFAVVEPNSRLVIRPIVVLVAVLASVAIASVVVAIDLSLGGGPTTIVPSRPLFRPSLPLSTASSPGALTGKYCRALQKQRAATPSLPSQSGAAPPVDPSAALAQWEGPVQTDPEFGANVVTVESLESAATAIRKLDEANLGVPNANCLAAFNTNFTWMAADVASGSAGDISLSLDPGGWVLAAKSSGGTCWLLAHPLTASGYARLGVPDLTDLDVFAESTAAPCQADAKNLLWQVGYPPPQLR